MTCNDPLLMTSSVQFLTVAIAQPPLKDCHLVTLIQLFGSPFIYLFIFEVPGYLFIVKCYKL